MPKQIIAGSILFASLALAAGGIAASPQADIAFLDETHHAMDRMMAGMDSKPSGDADRDFATMMIPHHQGAIDMAVSELRHGHDERLRRIAQEIVVDQQQEIVVMRDVLAEKGAKPSPAQATAMDMSDGRMKP